MKPTFPRVAVLLSGAGTTLQNLIDERAAGRLPIEIVLVISSNPKAYGLVRAAQANIPSLVFTERDKEKLSTSVFEAVAAMSAELIVMAGWLKQLSIPPAFERRVVNIHPSLLPEFGGHGMYGRHVHEAVFAAGRKQSGCTVHYVDDLYDHGEIILQKKVDISACTDAAQIAECVADAEKIAYPEAIRQVLGITLS